MRWRSAADSAMRALELARSTCMADLSADSAGRAPRSATLQCSHDENGIVYVEERKVSLTLPTAPRACFERTDSAVDESLGPGFGSSRLPRLVSDERE